MFNEPFTTTHRMPALCRVINMRTSLHADTAVLSLMPDYLYPPPGGQFSLAWNPPLLTGLAFGKGRRRPLAADQGKNLDIRYAVRGRQTVLATRESAHYVSTAHKSGNLIRVSADHIDQP